jgi:beta-phosphoglucomutase-like phosphatase (HAD superfamily)
VNETREYGTWADWLGVPRHTFSAVFGAVIARGLDYRETFQVFAPGFDLDDQREARAAAGQPETFDEQDLYPDVRPALAELHDAGVWVGIAGNQTTRAGAILRSLRFPAELIVTSDDPGSRSPIPGSSSRSSRHARTRRRRRCTWVTGWTTTCARPPRTASGLL